MKLSAVIISLLFLSCNKSHTDTADVITQAATIVWTGAVEADGCDWCIKTDALNFYRPDILNPAFRQNQLQVTISYRMTNEHFICGNHPVGTPVIKVIDIRKR